METIPKTFHSVQALRGLAAMAVVIYHGDLSVFESHIGSIFSFRGGETGVDLFFAISGFVMVMSTARSWGQPGAWSTFLLRRLLRVAPLYWFFTLLKVGSITAFAGFARHSALDWPLLVFSLLFVPAWNSGHNGICPVLPVGWTLSYEMFFYLIFALSLCLCKKPLWLLVPLLLFLAALSSFRTPAWGAPSILINPILLEFVYGILIALLVRAGRLLPTIPALVLAVAMLAVLITSPYLHLDALVAHLLAFDPGTLFRPLTYGIPCSLLLYAGISLEQPARRYLTGLPQLLGDASYSIYLSHAFVILPLGIAWEKLHWTGTLPAYALIALSVVVSAFVGIGVHWIIENPLLHYLNKKVHQPDPVGIGSSSLHSPTRKAL